MVHHAGVAWMLADDCTMQRLCTLYYLRHGLHSGGRTAPSIYACSCEAARCSAAAPPAADGIRSAQC